MMNQGNFKVGPTREVKALVFMTVLALALLVYIGVMKLATKVEPESQVINPVVVGKVTDAALNAKRRKLLERIKKQQDDTVVDDSKWEPIDPNDVSVADSDYTDEQIRKDAREKSDFIPMAEEFLPLEVAARQIYRVHLTDRVLIDKNIVLTFPDGREFRVVKTTDIGAVLNGGAKDVLIPWGEIPSKTFYKYALSVTKLERVDIDARTLVYLAQLATLAEADGDAAKYRRWASRIHFKERFVELFAREDVSVELDGIVYGGGGADEYSLSTSSGETPKLNWRELPAQLVLKAYRMLSPVSDTKMLAHDALHASRIYEELGRHKEAESAASIVIASRPMLRDELEMRPQPALNFRILDEYSWVWDPTDNTTPDSRSATNLADDAPAVLHIYQYMRTLGERQAELTLFKEKNYQNLLRRPDQTRGLLYKIRGKYIREYKRIRFRESPEQLAAGVREMSLFFLSDVDDIGGSYLVAVPHSLKKLKRGDFVEVSGMYLRRWPYLRDMKYKWIPWVVASSVKKVHIKAAQDFSIFIIVIVIVSVIGGIWLFVASMRDWKANRNTIRHLHSRRRNVRDNIRSKVKNAEKKAEENAEDKPDAEVREDAD